ncbi:GNAT family N-acetyltransferase [Fibrella aquatica]|uniref:GNAT family N-acetyltransferase n=1 Tax=Fibrella aquatica TaxID=3242487 RepID=UPI00351FA2FF
MITIRTGVEADILQVFDLIVELAVYEEAADQMTNTVEQLREDGFGANPLFHFMVAEDDITKKLVGISLYYFRYSTWKGKRLYLEDIIITESHRGQGLGKVLLDATIAKARELNCTGMMWQVLDWNEPAIGFYKQFGTRFDDGWTNCHLDF